MHHPQRKTMTPLSWATHRTPYRSGCPIQRRHNINSRVDINNSFEDVSAFDSDLLLVLNFRLGSHLVDLQAQGAILVAGVNVGILDFIADIKAA